MKKILVDSCVWIAAFYKKDKNHPLGVQFLEWFKKQENILIITTDYIISETITYLRKKAKNKNSIKDIIDLFLIDQRIEIYFTSESFFHRAMQIFIKYDQLSFVDSTLIVFYINLKTDYMLSYDVGFNSYKDIIRFESPL